MYEYKQIHVWLIVVPFWVLHMFGAPSILSKYQIFHVKKDPITVGMFAGCGISEDDIGVDALEEVENKDQICLNAISCTCKMKRFVKHLKRRKNFFKDEFIMCDNRIDKIDHGFTTYVSATYYDTSDSLSVTVV